MRGRIKRKIKKMVIWVAKEVARYPFLKTKTLSLLNHFPDYKLRFIKLVKGMEPKNSSSDFLIKDVNSLSHKERQIYYDLLKAIEQKKTGE